VKPAYNGKAKDRNISVLGRNRFLQILEVWILKTPCSWDCKIFSLKAVSVTPRFRLIQVWLIIFCIFTQIIWKRKGWLWRAMGRERDNRSRGFFRLGDSRTGYLGSTSYIIYLWDKREIRKMGVTDKIMLWPSEGTYVLDGTKWPDLLPSRLYPHIRVEQ
jgi:hypothetical protein